MNIFQLPLDGMGGCDDSAAHGVVIHCGLSVSLSPNQPLTL
jgi:hypothetical protein